MSPSEWLHIAYSFSVGHFEVWAAIAVLAVVNKKMIVRDTAVKDDESFPATEMQMDVCFSGFFVGLPETL